MTLVKFANTAQTTVNTDDSGKSSSKPFYNGNPWFLPLIIAWLKHVDRRLTRD